MNWIEVTKNMADNLNSFSDDEESEWLVNIDPSLLDKSNEEKPQLDNRFSAPIPFRFTYLCQAFPVNEYPQNFAHAAGT